MTTLADVRRLVRNTLDMPRIVREQTRLLKRATRIIVQQQEDIEELQKINLELLRDMQGLTCGWLISLETPEEDMRETLVESEANLAQRIAVIEEHLL